MCKYQTELKDVRSRPDLVLGSFSSGNPCSRRYALRRASGQVKYAAVLSVTEVYLGKVVRRMTSNENTRYSLVVDHLHKVVPLGLSVRFHVSIVDQPLAHLRIAPSVPNRALRIQIVIPGSANASALQFSSKQQVRKMLEWDTHSTSLSIFSLFT